MTVATATALILGFATLSSAHSALKETWFQQLEPTWDQVKRWKPLAGTCTLRLELDAAPSVDLAMKLKEAGFARVQVVSTRYPIPGSVKSWKELAELGVEFIAMVGTFPTSTEVRLFNEIAFPRTLFVLSKYPEYRMKNVFLPLEVHYDLHFNLNRYPQYLHRFPIAELPLHVGVQVSVDYWPRYVQMDILNLIPQTKRLRIQGTPLSAGAIPYVQNLQDIREIAFESDFEPPHGQWAELAQFPVRWILKDRMPSEAMLQTLKTLTSRSGVRFQLSLDPGRRPNEAEVNLYDSLPFDVEWTADAP